MTTPPPALTNASDLLQVVRSPAYTWIACHLVWQEDRWQIAKATEALTQAAALQILDQWQAAL